MHLDDEQVERLRHGELRPEDERNVRQHVAACAVCRSLIAKAEREEADVYRLLRGLDHDPPQVDASTIAARARGRSSIRTRWAAGILVAAVAASAAIAAPGLPVRGWLTSVVDRISTRSRSAAPQTPAVIAPAAPSLAGIAVAPGENLQVMFASTQSSGEARVSLTQESDVHVRSATGAARFTSDAGRLIIDNTGSTSVFEIRIPRDAPRVEIRVNGIRVFLKQQDRITAPTAVDAQGIYVLSLNP